ncbi:nitroreductase family protein [Flavilitoribacter nigricans]|uniref:Putative NAD(P)H nitroreductase n=1 Tax=Flavilitoribacter nigricans (strain ATCC 23147 / DSM 23189 / NBRC 102662 / NCIMB 1420 / SS-2) TaxID=1122177 RepID=A0A2D0N7C9_FLAN2|nr:nitroreductase [Flavilitoribacter nigricans]PHN03673.1 nitroreductase [Flavilitoribacter nigricans DSM 23189 = NBRC 102662]
MDAALLNDLIRKRRSIFPESYIEKPIEKKIIEQVLENANWAPNHKLTEPWRFRIYQGKALQSLSDYLANWYRENTPPEQFSAKKYEKTQNKPLRSDCVIAICMQRDPKESLPEWEEVAAVACAVQNMWLTCTAYGIGSYWSSPRSIIEAREFLDLADGELCLGLFYMGYHALPDLPGRRSPIEEKVTWV